MDNLRFISRGLTYEATFENPTMLRSIHRVFSDTKRRAVPCSDKQFHRLAHTCWRIVHNMRESA